MDVLLALHHACKTGGPRRPIWRCSPCARYVASIPVPDPAPRARGLFVFKLFLVLYVAARLVRPQLGIETFLSEQLLVGAVFGNFAFVKHDDPVHLA